MSESSVITIRVKDADKARALYQTLKEECVDLIPMDVEAKLEIPGEPVAAFATGNGQVMHMLPQVRVAVQEAIERATAPLRELQSRLDSVSGAVAGIHNPKLFESLSALSVDVAKVFKERTEELARMLTPKPGF